MLHTYQKPIYGWINWSKLNKEQKVNEMSSM